jgi:hypothetical protein
MVGVGDILLGLSHSEAGETAPSVSSYPVIVSPLIDVEML